MKFLYALFPVIFLISSCGANSKGSGLVEMVFVEGGSFEMGSELPNDSTSVPVHKVRVGSFYISKTEVTQLLYAQVMGTNPSFKTGDKLPVDQVTWYGAVEFCNKLSEAEGLSPAYEINKVVKDLQNLDPGDTKKWQVTLIEGANGYRLPTEAQWEFAARGGLKSKGTIFAGSNTINETGWYYSNSKDRAHDVGAKEPNELGIFDMVGNAFEWCFDWFGPYQSGDQENPQGANASDRRVLRGGSWSSHDYYRNSGSRDAVRPGYTNINVGIRLVKPS